MEWQRLPLPVGDDLAGIAFSDENTGYVVTTSGMVIKTSDGGETFTVLDYKTPQRPEDIFFISDDYGFVFGERGYMALTTDGGQNWEQIPHDTTYSFRDMNYLDKKHGFVVGVITSGTIDNIGFIGKTTDQGRTWDFDTTTYSGFRQIDVLEPGHLFIAASGNILYSIDKGETWEHNAIGGKGDVVNSLFFASVEYGWVVGDDGLWMYSENGGWSWRQKKRFSERNLNCVVTPELPQLFMAGENIIAHSTNSGRTWDVDSTDYQVTFTDIQWVGEEIYLAGSHGTLLKLTH